MFQSLEQSLAFLLLTFTHTHTHGRDRKALDEVKRYTESSDSGWIVDANSLYLYKKKKENNKAIYQRQKKYINLKCEENLESGVKILKRLM